MKRIWEKFIDFFKTRKAILIRFLWTILYLIVFEILKTIIQLIVLIQYVMVIATRRHSRQLRTFSNKVTTLAYHVLRYVCLLGNTRPYPLNDFPTVIEPPEETVKYDSK
jgi:hypothetical protein